jgi:hypothetical protein
MRQFVVNTESESGDRYTYLIEHDDEPTREELDEFLLEHGNDVQEDDDYGLRCYEYVQDIIEIKDFIQLK